MERAVDCIKSCVAAGIHGHHGETVGSCCVWAGGDCHGCFAVCKLFRTNGGGSGGRAEESARRGGYPCGFHFVGFAGMYRGRRDLHAGTVDRPIDGK